MTMTAILLFVTGLAAGVGAGWFFFRHRAERQAREQIEALERSLSDSHEALDRYRAEVGRHFDTAAALFTDVSIAQRQLHRHLAEGYEKLTGRARDRLLPEGIGSAETQPGADAVAAIPLAYAADRPLDETAGDDDDPDDVARQELDAVDETDEPLPETVGIMDGTADTTHPAPKDAEPPPQFAARESARDHGDGPVEFGEITDAPDEGRSRPRD